VNTPQIRIERIAGVDGIDALAAVARVEEYQFLNRLLREWADGINRFVAPNEALFGAFDGDRLVGVAALNRQGPELGRVRHVYVHPDYRRRGVARALVSGVLDFADRHYPVVVLRTPNPSAAKLYECLGFLPEVQPSADTASHRRVRSEVPTNS